jgi:hypothetical protein
MLLSGISTVFVPPTITVLEFYAPVLVVIDAEIQGNELIGNAQISGLPAAAVEESLYALGGVILGGSINASVRENVIRDHGSGHVTPICGVGAWAAQNLTITDNRIVDNGTLPPAHEEIDGRGMRGGIVAMEVCGVRGYTFRDAAVNVVVPQPSLEFARSESALFVHGNEVSQRIGRALLVKRGFGPIVVTENSLHTLGDPVDNMAIEDSELKFIKSGSPPHELSLPSRGACVEIVNYATSSEVTYSGTLPSPFVVDPGATSNPDGRVLFNDNHTQLVWSWWGGFPSSVLISTLDSIVANHNTMMVSMGNTPEADDTFIVPALIDPSDKSFVMANCWLGATSTAQATGNRFEEGLADAFLSCLLSDSIAGLGAGICVVKMALLATMNVGTHCVSGKTPGSHQRFIENNITVHGLEMGTCTPSITFAAVATDQVITVAVP